MSPIHTTPLNMVCATIREGRRVGRDEQFRPSAAVWADRDLAIKTGEAACAAERDARTGLPLVLGATQVKMHHLATLDELLKPSRRVHVHFHDWNNTAGRFEILARVGGARSKPVSRHPLLRAV